MRYSRPGVGRGTAGLLSGLSLIGLALSVFGLILVMSVMNGFERELQSRMLALTPHAKINAKNLNADNWRETLQQLSKSPQINTVAPYSEGSIVLKSADKIAVTRLSGIDTAYEASFSQLASLLVAGSYKDLNAPFTIAIGSGLARRLGLTIDDVITAILPRVQITPFGPVTKEKSLEVVAVFSSGTELDSTLAFANLESAKKILSKRKALDGLKINSDRAYANRDYIELALSNADLEDNNLTLSLWQEENAALYSAVVMEKLMIFILLLCVVAVASFSIVAIVLMSVIDKKSDIAILRTMGASTSQIKRVFLLQGAAIGTMGTIAGAGLACLIAPYVGTIFQLLEKSMGFQLFDPDVYYISYLPSVLKYSDVIIVTLVSIGISVLVSLFPAARASRLDPVEALAVVN